MFKGINQRIQAIIYIHFRREPLIDKAPSLLPNGQKLLYLLKYNAFLVCKGTGERPREGL